MFLSNNDGQPVRKMVLGPDVFNYQQPQVVVAKWEWQRAQSWGDWTLVGTTGKDLLTLDKSVLSNEALVAPGFVESGLELALPNWEPNEA